MKCILCNSEIDKELVKYEEEISGEPFKEGYCSSQCKETDGFITANGVQMTIYSLLQELKTVIILNPFEWTICWGMICFFTGSYLEHLIGWFSPIKEEEEECPF